MAPEVLFQCSSPSSSFGFDRTPKGTLTSQPDASLLAIEVGINNIGDEEEEGRIEEAHPAPKSQRLSDVHMASRKASEAASRRFQAVAWLQRMVGPVDLPPDPSEEELRLCLRNGLLLCNLINKIHPGAVLKIVENPPAPSSPPPQGAALSAYQYFENVRNFLVAVEEMNLPSFEASDLEKGSLQTGSSAKVVDCILALKAYHEWQSGGGQGLWKFAGPWKSPCALKPSAKMAAGRYLDNLPINAQGQFRKRWAFQGPEGSKGLPGDYGNIFTSAGKVLGSDSVNFSGIGTDSCGAWVQQFSQFVDAFHAKSRSTQNDCTLEFPDHTRDFENIASESLSKLVMLLLSDKKPDEVPTLVEFMLRKVMEEFDKRLLCQEVQSKRSHAKSLEDLPTGMRDCSESRIQALQMELERVQLTDQQRAYVLESQNNELKWLRQSLDTTRTEFQTMDLAWKKEMESLDYKLKGLVQAASEYHKIAAENRELYNQVQDLKGNIRVYCRVRPFLPGQNGTQTTVDFIGEKGSLMITNPTKQGKDQRKSFNFNKVFGPSATQEEVFLDTQPLIRSVLDGYNVCIFAYGQTGSGKTFTMTGPNNPSPKDWGVNFRALHDLFQISQNRQDLIKYEVGVQMMEIYNEQVRDLLSTDGSNKKLEIRNSSQQNGLNVPDANMMPVSCPDDVIELMNLGHKNRAVGATALNERSSRSHSVLTVHVKGTDLASGAVFRGCLHLVDLAGSERVDKSEAIGDRLKEAQHINKSLSALGDVIAALAQKSSHIPYRNSKLTQLLQDSLGGQAKTLMFVHVSPEDESYFETISTLKFAERVATVELGAAQSNKEIGELRELKDQVAFLKDALAKKDAEIERVQKDWRTKNVESALEKPKVKLGISPCQIVPPKSSGDMVLQGQAKRRQPLEEVRNSEVRQSPSFMGQKYPSQMQPPHTPLTPVNGMHEGGFCGSQEEDYAIKRRAEGDTIKRRSKLPRQASCSPEEEEGEEEEEENVRTVNVGFSKNRIRREGSIEAEVGIMSSSRTPQERVRSSRVAEATTTPLISKTLSAMPTPPLHFHSETKKDTRFAAEASRLSFYAGSTPTTAASCCFEEVTAKASAMPAYSHYSGSSGASSRDDLDDASTGRRGGGSLLPAGEQTEDAEEEASSSCADQAADASTKLATNRRQSTQSRSASNKPSSGSFPKKKTSAAAGHQPVARPRRRYSLVGSNKDEAPGSKPSTLEAKLATIVSQESNSGECNTRAALPRQSMVGLAVVASKSSKRWM